MPISSILIKGGCDIFNYMMTPSDHQCTTDGGHFMLLANQYIEEVCAVTPTMACCCVEIITAYYSNFFMGQ